MSHVKVQAINVVVTEHMNVNIAFVTVDIELLNVVHKLISNSGGEACNATLIDNGDGYVTNVVHKTVW